MNFLLPFVFGFSTSFLGMVLPSMLNMTTVKINFERGRSNATRFALGVGTMVFVQAYLAIYLIRYINENPSILNHIQLIASIIFALLSVYFFISFKKEKSQQDGFKKDCRNTFAVGLLLSGLNMFAIPFYYGITNLLNNFGLLPLNSKPIFLFVIGSAIGSFLILYIYPTYFKKVVKHESKAHGKINLILSVITGFLSLLSVFKLF
jgi:threonine/homoserine/homoserine lactone efflux protein